MVHVRASTLKGGDRRAIDPRGDCERKGVRCRGNFETARGDVSDTNSSGDDNARALHVERAQRSKKEAFFDEPFIASCGRSRYSEQIAVWIFHVCSCAQAHDERPVVFA